MEFECPICHETITNGHFVTFCINEHRFCETCARFFLFHRPVQCPCDKLICKDDIIMGTSRRYRNVDEYRKAALIEDPKFFMNEIEKYWDSCFITDAKMVQLYKDTFEETIRRLESLSKRNCRIEDAEIEDIDDLLEKMYRDYYKMLINNNKCPFMVNLSTEYFRRTAKDKLSLFYTNVYSIISQRPFPHYNVGYLKDKELDQANLLREAIDLMKGEVLDLQEMKIYLAQLIISFVRNNRDVYQQIHPSYNEADVDTCLTCMTSIDSNRFVNFANCQHKICANCSHKFLITHGSCPFHDTDHFYLQMSEPIDNEPQYSDVTILNYQRANFYRTCTETCHEHMDFMAKVINDIIDIDTTFTMLAKETKANLKTSDPSLANASISKIQKLFREHGTQKCMKLNFFERLKLESKFACLRSIDLNPHTRWSENPEEFKVRKEMFGTLNLFMRYFERSFADYSNALTKFLCKIGSPLNWCSVRVLYREYKRCRSHWYSCVHILYRDLPRHANLNKKLQDFIKRP